MKKNNTRKLKVIVLTASETAELLRIARPKIYELIKNGTLEGVKVGGDWRIKRDSLEKLIGPIPNDYFDN